MPDNEIGTRRHTNRRPDFYQLEVFLKIAETRSFANAARQLGVSQPAVSQTIAKLEDLYGGDLFERRRGAPLSLTAVGRAILPKAKTLLFLVDTQMRRAVETAQSMRGSLTIGFHTGVACGPLHSGIAQFRATRPDVDLRLVEAAPSELHRQLNERTLDIVFAALLPDLSAGPNAQERLWSEDLIVAMRHDHPLAESESLRWADLSHVPIILRASQGDLSAYRAISSKMGNESFKCTLHDVSFGTLTDMVQLGFGATIIFAGAALARHGIVHRQIAEEDASISIEALWPKDDRNPLRHRLLASVRRFSADA